MQLSGEENVEPPSIFRKRGKSMNRALNAEHARPSRRLSVGCSQLPYRHARSATFCKLLSGRGDFQAHGCDCRATASISVSKSEEERHMLHRACRREFGGDGIARNSVRFESTWRSNLKHTLGKRHYGRQNRATGAVSAPTTVDARQNIRSHPTREDVYLVINENIMLVNARDLATRWSWMFRVPHFTFAKRESHSVIQGWIWKLKPKTESLVCSVALATRASQIPYLGRRLVANKRFMVLDVENRVFYCQKGTRCYSAPFFFNDIISVDICELTWAKDFGLSAIYIRTTKIGNSVGFCLQTYEAFRTWLYAFLLAGSTSSARDHDPSTFGELSWCPSLCHLACNAMVSSGEDAQTGRRTPQQKAVGQREGGGTLGFCSIFAKFCRIICCPFWGIKRDRKRNGRDAVGPYAAGAGNGGTKEQLESRTKNVGTCCICGGRAQGESRIIRVATDDTSIAAFPRKFQKWGVPGNATLGVSKEARNTRFGKSFNAQLQEEPQLCKPCLVSSPHLFHQLGGGASVSSDSYACQSGSHAVRTGNRPPMAKRMKTNEKSWTDDEVEFARDGRGYCRQVRPPAERDSTVFAASRSHARACLSDDSRSGSACLSDPSPASNFGMKTDSRSGCHSGVDSGIEIVFNSGGCYKHAEKVIALSNSFEKVPEDGDQKENVDSDLFFTPTGSDESWVSSAED